MTPLQIRAHLLMRGKNMKKFAEMVGTTKQNIHSVVNGLSKSKKYQQAIAEFIEQPVDEVFPQKAKDASCSL